MIIVAVRSGKARALLEDRLDERKMTNIEAIALTDRFFQQRRTIEGKSTFNVLHGVLVKVQREALELGMKQNADKPGKGDGKTSRPQASRKQAANV